MRNKKRAKPGNEPPPEDGKFSLISDEKLISLYRNLLRLQNAGLNGNHGAPRVPDAALVGTAIDLGSGDAVCSLDGRRFVPLSGAAAIETLLEDPGSSGGKIGVFPPPTAHTVIGAALANKTAGNGKVALIYCGCADPDCLREAIHIATVHALPIVFVKQADVSARTPARKEPKSKKNGAQPTPWFPSITVDTNDVVAVYRVANESISRARLGRGPTLIECRAFQVAGSKNGNSGHTLDPVLNMEHYLRARGLFEPKLQRVAATAPITSPADVSGRTPASTTK